MYEICNRQKATYMKYVKAKGYMYEICKRQKATYMKYVKGKRLHV